MDFKYGIYIGVQNGKIILTEKYICVEYSISGETDGSLSSRLNTDHGNLQPSVQ